MCASFDVLNRATGELVVRGVDRSTAESEQRRLNDETSRSHVVDGWIVNYAGDEYGDKRHIVIDAEGGE